MTCSKQPMALDTQHNCSRSDTGFLCSKNVFCCGRQGNDWPCPPNELLVQNLFSVAGPSQRPDVNQMLMQPFVNYNLKHGWYLTSSPIITSNWEANSNNRWTVPVGGGVGRIVHFGKLPVSTYAQVFRNVERPDGTTSWSARFQMTFLFPKR
jgi:hypothetical protein